MKKKIILDCDTGTDDAVAIMLGALHEDIELVAVTTVNGNVPVEYCTDNTLRTLDFIGADIPVYEGLDRPIVRQDFPVPRKDRISEGDAHGLELPIPPGTSRKQDMRAIDYLIETYSRGPSDITLVPVGPLTNIAAAISLEPKIVENIPEVVIMGGGHDIGNVTPSAEFNIWADPEAAAKVFSAGFQKITLVALDATHDALISLENCDELDSLGTPGADAAARFIRRRIEAYDFSQPMSELNTAPVHDALCVAYLVDPRVITTVHVAVEIETAPSLGLGRTVVDRYARGSLAPNSHVALSADRARFWTVLRDGLSKNLNS